MWSPAPLDIDFESPPVRDGATLHRSVSPEKWCVTLQDLKQVKRLVQTYVVRGLIKPTDRDGFEVADNVIGPGVYTTVSQLIKPLTDKAGKVSWALMLHPEGLKCDLFVTHAWSEGIYEFLNKVLHSWPRGAHHAYCCMLSNPQNLDIGDLISSPRNSPFAKALHSSIYMLAVPNRQCSIYSRIWCAYEAFLSHSEGKLIFTASARVPHRRLSMLFLVMVLALTISAVNTELNRPPADLASDYPSLVALYLVLFITIVPPFCASRGILYAAGFLASASLGDRLARLPKLRSPPTGGIFPSYGLLLALTTIGECTCVLIAESDRMRRIQAALEARELRSGYTGRLRDAQASNQHDKENILKELLDSGLEDDVNYAVRLLMDSGMSTPTLCTAARRSGRNLFTEVNWGLLAIAWQIWFQTGPHVLTHNWELHQWALFQGCEIDAVSALDLCKDNQPPSEVFRSYWREDFCESQPWQKFHCTPLLERQWIWICFGLPVGAAAWLVLFLKLPLDKRSFALRAMVWLIYVPVLIETAAGEYAPKLVEIFGLPRWYVTIPATLILSAAGPGWTSRVPVMGPLVVRALMTTCRCCWRWRKQERDGKQEDGDTVYSI